MSSHSSQAYGSRSTAPCLIILPVFSLIAAKALSGTTVHTNHYSLAEESCAHALLVEAIKTWLVSGIGMPESDID